MDTIKKQIEDIIANKPKIYTKIISKIPELLDWVNANTLMDIDHLPTRIYSAIYQKSNDCPHGSTKRLKRWGTGLQNCGPAKVCKCTATDISCGVKSTRKQYTEEQIENVNSRRRATMREKYGVEYNSQRQEIKPILSKPKISMDKHAKLMDYDWMYTEYVVNQRTAVDIANELSVYYSTVIEYCKYHDFKIRQRSNYSITETEIRSFLDELGIEYISNDRELLGNKELDILIPSKKLAIEVNGLYWHSFAPNGEKLEDRQRHLRKTEELSKYGITLLHVTDWEWHNKRDIIKSIIKSKLGICDRVFARKCSIYVPTANEVREFLNDNHLQGYIPAKFHVGLKHGDELVEVVSIGVNRYKSDKSMELLRLASKRNITVVGGAGKLLKHARGLISNAKIVSYCDRSKSNGSGYESMGFILHSITGPGYFWTNGTEIISRYKTQKKNLHKLLPGYDQKLSEAENMFNHGYRRYWDCGNFVFELQ